MGECKSRRKRLLTPHQKCAYCAEAQATQLDHCPPRVMFRNKDRPAGFEIPSCAECNQGTRDVDQVMAFFGRALEHENQETDHRIIKKILSGISNNIPGLLDELKTSRASEKIQLKRLGLPNDMGVFRCDGPLAQKFLEAFAYKMTVACHFECTRSLIEDNFLLKATYYSNFQIFDGTFPSEIFGGWPDFKTLNQGKKNASDQFQYSDLHDDNIRHGYFCTFRRSFAILGMIVCSGKYENARSHGFKTLAEVSKMLKSL